MSYKAEFSKVREKLSDLEKADAVQTEQIRTLFNATAKLETTMTSVFTRIIWVFGIILLLAILALVYGALGKDGFNGVVKAVPSVAAEVAK